MRDFHALSTRDQLYRLAEIAHEPYIPSQRTRRACIALIFRVAQRTSSPNLSLSSDSTTQSTFSTGQGYDKYLNPNPSYSSVIASLHQLASQRFVKHGQLELCLCQRARNAKDRWSGQIGFPGGRQNRSESDYRTCLREVHEEIGLNLSDTARFLFLGRLSDRDLDSFGNVKPLTVCPFVFIQLTETTPPLTISAKEIAATIFTPLTSFTSPKFEFTFLVHPLIILYTSKWTGARKLEVGYRVRRTSEATVTFVNQNMNMGPSDQSIKRTELVKSTRWSRLLPSLYDFDCTHFPAIALTGHFITADGRTGVSLGDKLVYDAISSPSSSTTYVQASNVDDFDAENEPIPGESDRQIEHGVDVDDSAMILWGFSLGCVSDLCANVLGVKTLDGFLQRGAKSRARALRVLYRTIEVVEAAQSRWRRMRSLFISHPRSSALMIDVNANVVESTTTVEPVKIHSKL